MSTPRKRFYAYHDGWIHGASIKAMDKPDETDLSEEYERGYTDGRQAYQLAHGEASKRIGFERLVLRPQGH